MQITVSDWISPPGDTILDIAEERGWTIEQLSQQLNYTIEYEELYNEISKKENLILKLQNEKEVNSFLNMVNEIFNKKSGCVLME